MSPHMLFNRIGNQQEILDIRITNYLLNLPSHIIKNEFIYIPWYNLLASTNEQEKIKISKMKMIMTLMTIMKHSCS
jgi:hypothetical protein